MVSRGGCILAVDPQHEPSITTFPVYLTRKIPANNYDHRKPTPCTFIPHGSLTPYALRYGKPASYLSRRQSNPKRPMLCATSPDSTDGVMDGNTWRQLQKEKPDLAAFLGPPPGMLFQGRCQTSHSVCREHSRVEWPGPPLAEQHSMPMVSPKPVPRLLAAQPRALTPSVIPRLSSQPPSLARTKRWAAFNGSRKCELISPP